MTTHAMSCENARPLLPAYGDGQLELSQALAVEAHVTDCAECKAKLEAQRELGRSLREQAPYQRMPEALRERLRASLRQSTAEPDPASAARHFAQAQPAFSRRRVWLHWAAPLAASLMLAMGANSLLSAQRADAAFGEELVAGHVRSLLAAHLDDVISTDQHTVKPWFAGKLDYAPPVHDFAERGFALAGGRLDYVGGRAVAALDYRHLKHVINLYVWPEPGADRASGIETRSRAGYHLVSWTSQGMRWWAVSDLNAEELRGFAELLRERPPG